MNIESQRVDMEWLLLRQPRQGWTVEYEQIIKPRHDHRGKFLTKLLLSLAVAWPLLIPFIQPSQAEGMPGLLTHDGMDREGSGTSWQLQPDPLPFSP